jgi:hypothetical protein
MASGRHDCTRTLSVMERAVQRSQIETPPGRSDWPLFAGSDARAWTPLRSWSFVSSHVTPFGLFDSSCRLLLAPPWPRHLEAVEWRQSDNLRWTGGMPGWDDGPKVRRRHGVLPRTPVPALFVVFRLRRLPVPIAYSLLRRFDAMWGTFCFAAANRAYFKLSISKKSSVTEAGVDWVLVFHRAFKCFFNIKKLSLNTK